MRIAFVFYHLLLVRAHGAADAAYAMPSFIVEGAMRHFHHLVQELPHVTLSPVYDRRDKDTLLAGYAAQGLLLVGIGDVHSFRS